MDTTLIDLLRRQADRDPGRKSFSFLNNGEREAATLTYAELDVQARRIGAMLQERKAQGERILLLYPPGLDFLAAFFACLYAGAIAVPAYPPRRHRQLSRIPAIVADARARFALTTKVFLPKIEAWFSDESEQRSLTVMATDLRAEEGREQQWSPPAISGQDLAFLQYTSGSTASPKGVMVSHANLLHNSALIYKSFGHSSESVFVSWLPHYHDMGLIGGILQPLFGGFPVILMSPAAFIQHPIRWLRAISTYRATTSGGPNFGYELCVDKIAPEQCETLDLQSWDVAFNGAEPVHYETIERFSRMFAPCGFRKRAFYPCFGLAEATLFVSGPRPIDPPRIRTFQESALGRHHLVEASAGESDSRSFVGCGQSPSEQLVCIVDPETVTQCPPEQIGEVWVSGPSVAQGYWKRTEETKTTFRAKLPPRPLNREREVDSWTSDVQPDRSSRLIKPEQGQLQGASASLNSQNGHLMAGLGGEFLRTGDLGFMHEGELFITGRLKDLIIIRGRNHYPEDIEWRVEHCHPLIRHEGSAVFTIGTNGEQRLVVAAEVEHQHWERRQKRRNKDYKGTNRRSPERLQPAIPRIAYVEKAIQAIRKVVADHHELQVYAVLLLKSGTMPKTSSGKTQRHLCRSCYLEGSLNMLASSALSTVEAAALEDALEFASLGDLPREEQQGQFAAYLARLIASVLRVKPDQIKLQHPLSHFGLGSIVALELQHRLESALNLNWPLTTFLSSASIAELAEEGVRQLSTAPEPRTSARIATHLRGKIPLSHNQRALWFLYRLSPQSAAYNVPFVLRIRSSLDRTALQRAFQRIIERHDVLRSTFHELDGEVRQHIHEHLPLPFEEVDVSGLEEEAVREKIAELTHRPFDLEKGPIMNLSLLNFADDDAILVVSVHHIAIDFWSLLVLMDELRMLYPSECGGSGAQLPLHSLSYADFVNWQLEMSENREGERLFAYWRKQLTRNLPEGELPILNLPIDSPRPAVQSFHGASHSFAIGQVLTENLRSLAKETGATLYMLLLSAFYVLLHRYSGQDDIIVGTPTAGRMFSEFDDVVGYFVNPVMLRVNLTDNPDFQRLLQQVRRIVLEALEHQAYPFPLLVERLKLQRDAGRSPGFQVMFVMQEPHRLEEAAPFALREGGAVMDLGGLQVESVKVEQRSAQFDLTLMLVSSAEGLMASIEYNSDLFNPDTIRRMAGHFQTVLKGIATNSTQGVAELPLLTEAERRQILVEWNDTAADYPKERCIHQLFEEQVERTPEALAVVTPTPAQSPGKRGGVFSVAHPPVSLLERGGGITYRELNKRANHLAHYLQKNGVGPEVLVGICIERSLEMIVGLLGILKAGGAYVPLDPDYPKERLTFMLQDSQAPLLLTQKRLIRQLPENQSRTVCLDADWELIAQENEENPACELRPDNLAYVLYTSGSTGKPKGVAIEHHSPVALVDWARETYTAAQLAGVLASTSICFDLSVFELFVPLCSGGKVVLVENALQLPNLPESENITLVNTVPSAMDELLRMAAIPGSVRIVNVAGEPLSRKIVQRIYQQASIHKVFNLYGPSEDTTYSTCAFVEKDSRRAPHIGRPIANTNTYILNRQLQPVPIGVAGELYLSGAGLAREYLHRPDFTKERFIPNPFSDNPKCRLYRTGDLVRYLPDGNIEFIGRIDHQVKIRGFRIELGEIEAVLAEHPGVQSLVVIAREDHPGEKRLVAYLVLTANSEDRSADLRHYLQERLPAYMVPSAFVVLDALPLTPNGKVDRRALPAPGGSRPELSIAYAMPQSELERKIAGLWQELLPVDKVGIHDNFFELGGHSLLAVRMQSRLQELLGQDVAIVDLFSYPTVHSLARYFSRASEVFPGMEHANPRIENRNRRRKDRNRRREQRQKYRVQP